MVRHGRKEGISMNSFYIEGSGAVGGVSALLSEEAKHAAQVLRLHSGEQVYAVDEAGRRFLGELQEVSKSACSVLLKEELSDNEAPVRITLYQGLPKADKLDLVVQKITELGAACIVPVKMERCVVKLDEKDGQKRRDRLSKIAREAAKQCKRGRAPEVELPCTWKQAMQRMQAHDLLLVPWEDAAGFGLKAAHALMPNAVDIGIVIGPEGGMSPAEIAAIEEIGARQITLGPRILRTETAAVAACAMAMLLWGDIG